MRRTTVAVSVAAGAAGIAALTRRRAMRLAVDDIGSSVTIARDDYGIPIISAGNRDDALFGLGFAVAQDRLWQMDLVRRSAYGRLSEIVGPPTLASDRLMRLIDIPAVATRLVAAAPDETRRALDAYCAGVNLRLRRGLAPVESRVLRYRIEPWRPEDCMAVLRLLGWSLSAFYSLDLLAADLRDSIGDEWTDAIFAGRTAQSPVVVREQGVRFERMSAIANPVLPPNGSSNAWALAGSRSTTGAPLLANDPHLGFTNPSVWCEARLDTPGFEVAGMTMPGLPAIVIGRTASFAWGITAAMVSQTFVYREQLGADGANAAGEATVVDGERQVPLVTREEIIRVKGREPERLTVRSTPRGPLISDLEPRVDGAPVSLYWMGAEIGHELDALLRLNAASSIDDLLDARELIVAPTLNITAADRSGNIATATVGRCALEDAGPGLRDPASHPPTILPAAELPFELNPARGWTGSANNRISGDDDERRFPAFYEPDYRIRRIEQLLEARERHALTDVRSQQLDLLSLHAADLTPALVELLDDSSPQWARDDLARWDYQTPTTSRATLLFEVFYRFWVQTALGHRLPEPLVGRLQEHLAVGDVPLGFCDRLLLGKYPPWMDGAECARLVRSTFRAALHWIEERLGPDYATRTWGAVHTVTFVHPFGQLPGKHRRFVNVGPLPLGGDRTTVWPSGTSVERPFEIIGGPSMRFVADLGDVEGSLATNTLGQRGRPLSRHYRDQVDDWLSGGLHPIWRRPVRRTVTLVPKARS